MSARRRIAVTSVGLALALFLAGCGDDGGDDDTGSELPNPASQFCVDQGGEVDIVDEADGQVGYCVLPDGTRVDEWEYYRENAENPETTTTS